MKRPTRTRQTVWLSDAVDTYPFARRKAQVSPSIALPSPDGTGGCTAFVLLVVLRVTSNQDAKKGTGLDT